MKDSKVKDTIRCDWCLSDPLYKSYHDLEWGVPLYDDKKLFEFLVLETFQAGLSWLTVLRKRESFREAFFGFDPKKVALFGDREQEKLLQNEKIVRNRLKIKASITNARAFLNIVKKEGSFAEWSWRFVSNKPLVNGYKKVSDIPTYTKEAERFSNVLKLRGFKFVGPTVIYAHMQATGMVNDHITSCFRYDEIKNQFS